jgi:hypothetical protein
MSDSALSSLLASGIDFDAAQRALAALDGAGYLACRWVDVRERAVPPDADTIIRTISRTIGAHSTSTTHWLDGLRGPRID